jgi:hypothetical protein
MLFIVPVRVKDSRCMGPRLVSWDFTIPAGVRLLVGVLVVVWPVVSARSFEYSKLYLVESDIQYVFSTFFDKSSQTHERSSTEFPEFLQESLRFDFRIEICEGVQFIKIVAPLSSL